MNTRVKTRFLNVLVCAGLFWSSVLAASVSFKSFTADSLTAITDARNNRAFIVVLWSVECPPCLEELALLQQLQNQLATNDVILISTDGGEHATIASKVIGDHQLERFDNWIFAETMPEKLRYAIDTDWYGELPRAYFYDSEQQRYAHSGMLSKKLIMQWLKLPQANPSPKMP